MFLSTLVVYDSDFETKGKKNKSQGWNWTTTSTVECLSSNKKEEQRGKETYLQLILSSPPQEWVPVETKENNIYFIPLLMD